MPCSYVIVFERAMPERVLFVSSNVQKVLGYAPCEMVGSSYISYAFDPYASHYSCEWPADNPDIDVVLLPINLRRKDGSPVFTHTVSINCSGVLFAVVTAFPERGRIHIADSVLYKLKFEAPLSGAFAAPAVRPRTHAESTEPRLVHLRYPKVTRESLKRAQIHAARSPRAKACFVLSGLADVRAHPLGPRVVFVTNSLDRILGPQAAAEAHEIAGVPFMSLVCADDVVRCATFLDALSRDPEPRLVTLRMRAGARAVRVEVLGAVSDDGAVVLCQRVRGERTPADGRDDGGYISLSEIVSSDPDTSDFPDEWRSLV